MTLLKPALTTYLLPNSIIDKQGMCGCVTEEGIKTGISQLNAGQKVKIKSCRLTEVYNKFCAKYNAVLFNHTLITHTSY